MGEEAARGEIAAQLNDLVGPQAAEAVQGAVRRARIAGLLPPGIALDETGAAPLVAERVMGTVAGLGPVAVIGALMGITFTAISIVPTAALVLLMTPIVLSTATQLQLCRTR